MLEFAFMLRSLCRSPFAFFSVLCVVIACSNESNDFFGDLSEAGTGGAAGSNTSKGGTTSGSGGSSAGRAGSASAGTSASGGSPQNGGSTGASAGASPIAGSSAGGSAPTSGGSGDGAGEGGGPAEPSGGMGGTPDEMGGAGAGGTGGGGAGATGGTNSGGTGAAGTSGSAGSGAAGNAGSGGSGGAPGTVCEDADDCESDEYCAKESCGADTGTCAPRPESCTGEQAVFSPVCGCDWMTYYTACVAAREGVSVRSSGECSGSSRPTCNRDDGGDSCSPQRKGARCYRPRMGCEGTSSSMGVCWVLPDECPEEEKVNTYCGGTSGDAECVGLCEVLDREDAVFRNSPACSD
jgi:hypothetical protein